MEDIPRRIDKVQKEFINTAAHELRTPIMPILEEAEYIEHQFNDNQRKVVVENEQIALFVMQKDWNVLRLIF